MCVLSAVEVLSDMFDVEKAFSWIVSTSGFVSWIGLKLHHPNEKLQLTKEEARIFLQVRRYLRESLLIYLTITKLLDIIGKE